MFRFIWQITLGLATAATFLYLSGVQHKSRVNEAISAIADGYSIKEYLYYESTNIVLLEDKAGRQIEIGFSDGVPISSMPPAGLQVRRIDNSRPLCKAKPGSPIDQVYLPFLVRAQPTVYGKQIFDLSSLLSRLDIAEQFLDSAYGLDGSRAITAMLNGIECDCFLEIVESR